MSGQIKVDFSSLAELQSQVNSSAQKILTEIEDLKRTVNGTQAYWTGAAQDQFGARYAQLETAQKNVQGLAGPPLPDKGGDPLFIYGRHPLLGIYLTK